MNIIYKKIHIYIQININYIYTNNFYINNYIITHYNIII